MKGLCVTVCLEDAGRWAVLAAALLQAGISGGMGAQTAPGGTAGKAPSSSPAESTPKGPLAPGAGAAEAQSQEDKAAAPERRGTVLFQSHGEPPKPGEVQAAPHEPGKPGNQEGGRQESVPDLTDREREAFSVTRYDLDLRLEPRRSGVAMRAKVTLRNSAVTPLLRVPLQVSSTLHWEGVTELRAPGAGVPVASVQVAFAQHTIQSDADHTGSVSEAIVTLPAALAPGAEVTLDVLYAGTLEPGTGRLRRIGATAEQASAVDWDGVGGEDGRATAMRGFGNVLWYPVVSPQLFLGSGNDLFRAVGAMRRRQETTVVKLRISTDYAGEPPAGVYFCGRRQAFRAISDASDAPVASGTGVAVAEFAAMPVGFRTLSLFVAEHPEILTAPLPDTVEEVPPAEPAFSSSAEGAADTPSPAEVPTSAGARKTSTRPRVDASGAEGGAREGQGTPMLAVETGDDLAVPALAASAERVTPLLMSWFGARPLSALTVLDAPGQPFQDGPLLRAPVATLGTSPTAGVLVHSLTAAWVQTGQPWMDEGLSEFMELLWTEGTAGRPAALAQLAELMTPVNLAEPAPERLGMAPAAGASEPASTLGDRSVDESLIAAGSELFYRRKAAAVWWMLRDLAGDAPLRQTLSAWRVQPPSEQDARTQAVAFERLLEKASSKDLGWFFDDWVLRDRGLPDLTLVDVTPRQLPAGQGHDSGWLVAVTVRNDGAAVADVPLVVRSGSFSSTRRLRVPGLASVTERVLVEAPPTEVVVNDGSVPEVRVASHSRSIVTQGS